MLFLLSGCTPGTKDALEHTEAAQGGQSTPTAAPTLPEFTPLTQFGLLTVLPESIGSTFAPGVIAAISTTNVRYMRVGMDWAISEPEPGQITFESRNDQIIQNIEAAGLRVFPTLYVGRGWMNGNPPGKQDGGSRSYPPDDLSSQWDDGYGYSPSYYHFVYTIFQHYQGHFDYVAIENEANSKVFWGGSAEEYVRLLQTAYLAIKAADPQVTIMDSGPVSILLGLCVAEDYSNNGLKTQEEIIQFVTDYYSEGTGKITIRTAEELERALSRAQIQEQCQRINYILDHLAGAVDAVNFHFYEDYRALPLVVEWLRSRSLAAGHSPAIVSNEMGIRGLSTGFAESPAHAKEVFKKMITASSLNLQAVVWFSADTIQAGKDKVGLFDSEGQMRMAGNTLKLVADTLGPGYHFKEARSTGPALYHYLFEDTQVSPSLEAIWVEGSPQFIQLEAPVGASQATIIDYAGESFTLPIKDGYIDLFCGDAPQLVVWK